jgi:hypothetical protein
VETHRDLVLSVSCTPLSICLQGNARERALALRRGTSLDIAESLVPRTEPVRPVSRYYVYVLRLYRSDL